MAYDDGYYYGQCKIVAVVDNTADNGKTVLITTDDNKTYSGTIANKRCEFLLPPRTLYTVQKVSSGSAEFTTKVEAGYGDCILVHLDTGYVEVKQGDIVGLDYIKAATDANLKNKVPEAKAVKEVNNSLGGFSFKTTSGKKQVSTDGGKTWSNFSSGAELLWTNPAPNIAFPAQTLSIDLSNYDGVFIISKGWYATSSYTPVKIFIPKDGEKHVILGNQNNAEDGTEAMGDNSYYTRYVTVTNNGITFSLGYVTNGTSGYANACIPVEIYGTNLTFE